MNDKFKTFLKEGGKLNSRSIEITISMHDGKPEFRAVFAGYINAYRHDPAVQKTFCYGSGFSQLSKKAAMEEAYKNAMESLEIME